MTCCRCSQPADAWMTFDYELRHIEIVTLREDWDRFGGYAMCDLHADRLRPPVGWDLTDVRDTALTLFPVAGLVGSEPASPASDVA